jgi:hypothetical protein
MCVSGYQFKKTRIAENKYFVEMSDGDFIELTTAPPGVTTGNMGSVAFDGTASPIPASFSNLNDVLLVSNGVDQHKLYPGATSYVSKFIKFTEGGNPINSSKAVLDGGFDYTDLVTDGQSSTVATLSSLGTAADGDGVFICTDFPAKSFTLTLTATNSNAATLTPYYWKTDSSWAAITDTDGTESPAGTSLGQSGTITFTPPTDMMARYLFGRVGYWYLLVWSAALDASCTVQSVTYNAAWHSLESLWDGAPVTSPEVLVYDSGATTYTRYSGDSVDLDSLPAAGEVYIYSLDPCEAIYLDPGDTPDAAAQTIEATGVSYWNGTAWASATVLHDGSNGLSNPGWVLFQRQSAEQPRQLLASKLFGYWYKLEFDDAVAADVVVKIATMPYFDIHDWGYYGQANCSWKERALWTFADKFQEYVYLSAVNAPQCLTGVDSAIIEVGDGRPHKITAIKNFFNNVLVFQEEKGEIGGCVTMLQGYDVPTFGKLVLSTKLGTFSAKSADVVENVYTATATDETLKTVCFFLSRYGVVACDGTSFAVISDPIQNYFDPNDSNCINYNAYKNMWLKHDPVDHVIRIGLCCGSSTVPNIFPVYDLVDRVWYFDVRAQELAFWDNWEAGSGNVPWVQVGGGVDDGQLYQVNYGTADVTTAIESYVRIELNGAGDYLNLLWFVLQCKAQTGNLTLTTYQNNIAKDSLTLSMAAEYSTQAVRRHLLSLNIVDQQISLKISNSSTTETFTLYNTGLEAKRWLNR